MTNRLFIAVLLLAASIQFFLAFAENLSPVERSQLVFATKLLQKTAKNKSIILSPLSVSTALFMIYLATDGKTKNELQKFLGGNTKRSDLRLHFLKLLGNSNKKDNYTLNIANRFYVEEKFSPKQSFARTLQRYYDETLHSFTSAKSDKIVEHLLTSDSIDDSTAILLLNALYFSGTWEFQFDPNDTEEGVFHSSEAERKDVSMMTITDEFPYFEDDLVQVVKLPYLKSETQMTLETVIILPKKRFDLSNVAKNLSADKLNRYFHEPKLESVKIKLPKFRIEERINLKEALRQIGIRSIFSTKANFKELTDKPISVSDVLQAGYIEVNEKGTESAAATLIEMVYLMSAEPKSFTADHPFLFAIVQNLKNVLFLGQFVK
uniref:Serpin domain-containing protein n=1 Tax=Setaria digitata TaxID=48799 RepID=A0A915Q0N7_9BILA